jgi:hypothetical protein
MKRLAIVVAALAAAGVAAAGVGIPADLPPAPSTWPAYPRFPVHSCWARQVGTGVQRSAPSFAAAPSRLGPAAILRRVLARFGDHRYVRRIELAPPAPITLQHRGWFGGTKPPHDALWAYVGVPALTEQPSHPTAAQVREQMNAEWETDLVLGALRDEFCAAGGPPFVGWSVAGTVRGVSDRSEALGQRFPNPTPAAFRARLRAVGRRFGFTVVSLQLLRPLQLAPLVVVRTGRPRKDFVHDVPAIMRLLDPIAPGRSQTAVTFEGFLLEGRDARGAFVRVENVYRGEIMGAQWSWNRCVYPYVHTEPLGAKPCPR